MLYVRALARWLSSFLLHISLLLLILSAVFIFVFSNKTWLKDTVLASGIYTIYVDSVIAENYAQNKYFGSVPLDDPNVQRIANQSFHPKLLQENAEKVIDAAYNWLDGTSDTFNFEIDFSNAREQLIVSLADYATIRVDELPACIVQPETISIFELRCKPDGYDKEAINERLISDLRESDFLSNPIITEQSLPKNTSGKNFTEQFSYLPTIYTVLSYGIYIGLTALAVLTLVYLKIRNPFRKALRIYGRDLVAFSISILAIVIFSSFIFPMLTGSNGFTANSGGEVSRQINGLVDKYIRRIDTIVIYACLQIIAIGATVLVLERMSRSHKIHSIKKIGMVSSIPHGKHTSKKSKTEIPIQSSEEKAYKHKKTRKRRKKPKISL